MSFGPETHPSVPIGPGGVFQALIGSNTVGGIDPSVFTGANRWVEVQVGTDILSPRTQMVSVPYAFRAETLQPGATIQGDLSIGGELRVGDGTIYLTPSGPPPGPPGLGNSITFTQPAAAAPPQIRTTLVLSQGIVMPTGGSQLTINAGFGGNLNLNTLSTGTVRIGSGADQRVILQTTTTIQGNLNVQGYITGAIPPGAILPYAGAAAPPGFLPCDGTVRLRMDFQPLFDAIGTAFNVGGEAATEFRLPDMRGRFPLGVDNGAGRVNQNNNLGQGAGHEGIPFHSHGFSGGSHHHNLDVQVGTEDQNEAAPYRPLGAGSSGSGTFRPWGGGIAQLSDTVISGSVSSTGDPNSTNNLSPYQTVNYIIKY